MDRFTRTKKLIGDNRFAELASKHIAIIGLGAVGGYALEGLVRAGAHQLTLVDSDTIQPSNLNRQILALDSTLGRAKAEVAKERTALINPDCQVESLQLFAGDDTLDQILSRRPDILVDAIDSLNPKTQLLKTAYDLQIPTVSSMGAALRKDPLAIRTGDIFDSSVCPLARHLRRRLRRRQVGRGISCVYSLEKIDFEYEREEEGETVGEIPTANKGRPRNVLGSLSTITGIFGLTLANMAIFMLLNENNTLP